MTLPYERTIAVVCTRDFLLKLAMGEIKRIPKDVREQARRLLRHYPNVFDFNKAAESFEPLPRQAE